MRGEHHVLAAIRGRPLLFLMLSGVATGLSWLAYFRALQLAPASRVAPIDKLSLALTIALAALVLGEGVSWKVALGATLMVIGSLLTLSG
jgi:bacterial/archaeal transporter family protein